MSEMEGTGGFTPNAQPSNVDRVGRSRDRCHHQRMDPTSSEKEINRIESELDAINPPAGKPLVKRGGSRAEQPGNKSLDAVLVTAVLLFVVAAALVFAGQLKPNQRMQLTAGSIGGAIGLLTGYGVGRLRP